MNRLFDHWPDFFRRNPRHNSYSLFFALLAQLAGIVAAAGLLSAFPRVFFEHFWVVAVLQGICALLVAWWLRAPVWWLFIHLVFMPCVVMASGLALPSWIWFSGFFLLLLIFWRTDISRVPLYLTNRKSRDVLLSLLPAVPCRIIDIGCGDGGVLRYLARARPDCFFVGFEHAPLTWMWAWLSAMKYSNLQIRRGDFWRHSLASYDVIYAFLSPAVMARLDAKAKAEMMPTACLVSNSFAIPDVPAQAVIDAGDSRQTRFFIYRRP